VSDHDHAIVGLTFGDFGELYIQVGSNTNAGIPGPLSGTQLQKESYYSAATLVAHLSRPSFNGAITYSAPDDGNPVGGSGIEVFASGLRNPYGIVLHSNGKIYSTDNGPNGGYGVLSTGCGVNDFAPESTVKDELNLIKKGGYYGSPNRKRAAVTGDPRQCVYYPPQTTSTSGYTAPLMSLASSTNGIIEYEADHFGGQLRGNLIASKYTDGLFRIILGPDGESVIPQSNPALPLVGDDGLDVTQAPDGSLIEVRLPTKNIVIHKPNEPPTAELRVNAVFPRRGGNAGGYLLAVYGVNFSADATVTIGGTACAIQTKTNSKITCTVPGGQGTVDVIVSGTSGSYTFKRAFRYITGIGSQ
jgi:glucose/arabinose dehydrogenase